MWHLDDARPHRWNIPYCRVSLIHCSDFFLGYVTVTHFSGAPQSGGRWGTQPGIERQRCSDPQAITKCPSSSWRRFVVSFILACALFRILLLTDERMAGGWQNVHDEPFCLFYSTVFLMSWLKITRKFRFMLLGDCLEWCLSETYKWNSISTRKFGLLFWCGSTVIDEKVIDSLAMVFLIFGNLVAFSGISILTGISLNGGWLKF